MQIINCISHVIYPCYELEPFEVDILEKSGFVEMVSFVHVSINDYVRPLISFSSDLWKFIVRLQLEQIRKARRFDCRRSLNHIMELSHKITSFL